jgi:hypothetical protein
LSKFILSLITIFIGFSQNSNSSFDPVKEWDRLYIQAERPRITETSDIFSSNQFRFQNEDGNWEDPYKYIDTIATNFAMQSQDLLIGVFKLLEKEPMELAFLGRDTVHLLDLFEAYSKIHKLPFIFHRIGVSGDSFTDKDIGPQGAAEFLLQQGFDYLNIDKQNPWLVFELASHFSTSTAKWLRQPRFLLTGMAMSALSNGANPESVSKIFNKFRVLGLLEDRKGHSEEPYKVDSPKLNRPFDVEKGVEVWNFTAQQVMTLLQDRPSWIYQDRELYDQLWETIEFPHVIPDAKVYQLSQQRRGLLWHDKFGVIRKNSKTLQYSILEGALEAERDITLPFQIYLYEVLKSKFFNEKLLEAAHAQGFNLEQFLSDLQKSTAAKCHSILM